MTKDEIARDRDLATSHILSFDPTMISPHTARAVDAVRRLASFAFAAATVLGEDGTQQR